MRRVPPLSDVERAAIVAENARRCAYAGPLRFPWDPPAVKVGPLTNTLCWKCGHARNHHRADLECWVNRGSFYVPCRCMGFARTLGDLVVHLAFARARHPPAASSAAR